ncbi:MAG: DUF697 domain-containing protein [Imperialibacter sp.]|uniref:DUF697 domain-containing protein n=1 Tax=Imperialibacter sp. TaxID=2038411 RepID=UPI0032ED8687
MSSFSKEIKLIAVWLSAIMVFLTVLFLVNQVYQIYHLALAVNETFGKLVLVALIGISAGILLVPVFLFLRLPQTLTPPKAEEQIPSHKRRVFKRLRKNKLLIAEGLFPASEDQLEASLTRLNEEADKIIRQTALSVFLTTSISQNGRLDAFTILFTHSRMVWKICHLYHQRPGLRDLANLYANIGATTFLVSEIEDLDISLQLESLLSGVTKSTSFSSIPVVGPTATLVMDSLFEGSTNAFLTLRVGIIARQYCSCVTTWDSKKARKNATLEAGRMLSQIVTQGSTKVVGGILKAAKNAGFQSIKSGGQAIVKAGAKITEGVSSAARKVNPFGKRKSESEEVDQ